MVDPSYDKNALAVIGSIIVCWASIERQVASSVQRIEMAHTVSVGKWPPHYTDLSAFNSFKERKGHLLYLVEVFGTPQHVKDLNKIYRKLTKPGKIRHSLSHDLVTIMPKDEGTSAQMVNILNLGNFATDKTPEVAWKTVGELEQTFEKIRPLTVQILAISGEVAIGLKPKGK